MAIIPLDVTSHRGKSSGKIDVVRKLCQSKFHPSLVITLGTFPTKFHSICHSLVKLEKSNVEFSSNQRPLGETLEIAVPKRCI